MAKVTLEDGYVPSDDEPFMNDRQREYFRRKLLSWKNDILREAQDTLVALQSENENHPDLADRASSETDRAIELRARDRQRKLTGKIDAALARIEDGAYGFCEAACRIRRPTRRDYCVSRSAPMLAWIDLNALIRSSDELAR